MVLLIEYVYSSRKVIDMSENQKAIGVFDSGLGGLTAVKQLIEILPNENIVYFGDTGRVPYGTRSRDTIIKYSAQDADFLLSHNVKMIIAACGTASSVAKDYLENSLNVLYTGVVSPTAYAAAKITKNGKIGVIGTTATINSHSYKKYLSHFNSEIQVFEQDCPLFVPLVENGFISADDPVVQLVVKRYLAPLKEHNVDTVIMGCTHYPILREAIQNEMGKTVTLVDSGKETAIYAAKLLKENGLLSDNKEEGLCEFYVSDTPVGFSSVADLFLGKDIDSTVTQIDIEQY